ncbi:hypothetical protein KZZ52_33225 [Dactylosporangium sp. AC04546]|uniref:hypothetical protein n=1 Tax=Dactylosporangium sp. AC04546 TaxID=2862460 RepID=UPI001EE04732|nr:hypothetical protein [Dactylosporangium sp. AC04546]WVK78845.1 hypothetical protein KZZ52_33225 [Dactylosporangium sp. AC04546]
MRTASVSHRSPLPPVTLDTGAAVLLDEVSEAARPLWIVLREAGSGRPHPVLSRALQLVVKPGLEPGVPVSVRGDVLNGRWVLRATAVDVPAAIAAVLIAARDRTGLVPRLSCAAPERHPLAELLSVLDLSAASVLRIRSLLRRAEPDPARRPVVHTW